MAEEDNKGMMTMKIVIWTIFLGAGDKKNHRLGHPKR